MAYSVLVENVSKQFRLGKAEQFGMLREALVNGIKRLFLGETRNEDILWALNDISLEIKVGEVVGLIGRNGAGKSTLLKVLSKISYPSSGRVTVNGRVASLLEVGTGFHEELTGRENVYLNGSILGMKKKEVEAKFDAIVDFAGVERFIDTPIKRYSTGMRLRLGFAVAAHLDPEVLLVDEVLAVGDAGFQKKCLDTMEDLRSGGRTVVFVSHNMAAVENLCTRCVWIDGGRVREDGDPRAVIQSYMATFADVQQATSDLSANTQRHGSGEARFTRIELLSKERLSQPVTHSGDSLLVRLHYDAKTTLLHPDFVFRLHSEMGTLITETGTWHHGIDIPEVPQGKGYVDLEIDSLTLLPASYYISVSLNGVGAIVYDVVEHCVKLQIEGSSDIYRSSRVTSSRYGIVYFPQRWHLGQLRHSAPG
ncbi:MAG: ABC transporter ATP-binding protein [Nitrospiraceae bacterium]